MSITFFWPEDGLSLLADENGDERDRNPWDVVAVGGYDFPGICEIVGLKSARDRITMKGQRTDGAKKAWRGYKPAEFDIRCTIWTKRHLEKLEEIIDVLWSRPKGKTPEIFPIAHPQCQRLGIRQISVTEVLGLAPGKETGSMVQVIKVQEHIEPEEIDTKPSQGKTKGNKKNASAYPPDDASRKLATNPGTDVITEVDGKIVSEEHQIVQQAKQEDIKLVGR